MRNIPVFTTQFGVASLVLQQIPYTGTAYITIQSSLSPAELIAECASFCRAAGAEKVYATGTDALTSYPLHTQVLRMEVLRTNLAKTDAIAVPILPEQTAMWQKLYNQKMIGVDNAAYMDDADAKMMLQRGDGYFIYDNQTVIGLGRASAGAIRTLASTVHGGGRNTVLALAGCLQEEQIHLEVASTNRKAIQLYEMLGFRQTAVSSSWYKIL